MASPIETIVMTLAKFAGITPEMVGEQLKNVDQIRQIIAGFKAQQDDLAARLVRIENLLSNRLATPGELNHAHDPRSNQRIAGDTQQPIEGD